MSTSPNFHIVASDLDGTLLLPNHSLGEFTKKTLKTLHQQGFTFIFATGRHHVDVMRFREIVGIPAYMITANGARVHTPDNTVLYSNNIDSDVVQPIVDLIKQDAEHTLHIYRSNDWLTNKIDEQLSKHHQESGFNFSLFDPNNAPCDDIAKIFFTHTDHDHLVNYEKELNQQFGDRVSVAFSTPWCLEVMALNVSKGAALEAVATHLGKSTQQCIAFGDGMNDVEMLSVAHTGLVMKTAHDTVKKNLPNNQVIGSCEDEAVAHYLNDNLLN